MGKLILSHGIKYIALILGMIQSFFQKITAGVGILLDLCVMTADNIICTQFLGFLIRASNLRKRLQSMQGFGVPPFK